MQQVTGIIGDGSAGLTVAEQLTHGSSREVIMLGTGRSIPERYPDVIPNSPVDEFLSPIRDASDRIPSYLDGWYHRLVEDAHERPRLEHVVEMEQLLYHTVRDRDRFTYLPLPADEIRKTNRGHAILAGDRAISVDAVVCCQGSRPRPLPQEYTPLFPISQRIGLTTAFDPDQEYNGINIAVIGAAHTAAIAARNALENGVNNVELWHRRDTDQPVRKYEEREEDGVTVKYNRFTGVREPHYTRLQEAVEEHGYTTRNVQMDPPEPGRYEGWYCINATGFRPNPLYYEGTRIEGVEEGSIGEDAPRAVTTTGDVLQDTYITGIAGPKTYEDGCLDTGDEKTVEEDGAQIAGINLTLQDAKHIREELR